MAGTEVPILHARTLAEAYLFLNLVIASDDLTSLDETEEPAGTEPTREPAEPGGTGEPDEVEHAEPRARGRVIDYERWTTLTEGRTAWTLLFDGPDTGPRHRIIIVIPYETEFAARHGRPRFGPGRSDIIDPGQWQLAGAGYAHRALREAALYAENPTDHDRFQEVVANWAYARDAVAEAAKFLPDGADEIPEEAFWTEEGATTRRDEPERFTRDGLQSDLALYQHHLDRFVEVHGPPP
ncbi:hypothetical protein DQ384_03895 [Sphaerisporangium album]|uniref:Uncharacterized protein n=1 Tax=Sphaerisporangium album TaxID=509200 RepID=A0A367FS65_9ACTN|nr:hypothetical protein DQ384_03895 [Sphaerisporangium album]